MSYYTGLKLSGGRETFLYKGYVSEKTQGIRSVPQYLRWLETNAIREIR